MLHAHREFHLPASKQDTREPLPGADPKSAEHPRQDNEGRDQNNEAYESVLHHDKGPIAPNESAIRYTTNDATYASTVRNTRKNPVHFHEAVSRRTTATVAKH